jgi:hypothetical protein
VRRLDIGAFRRLGILFMALLAWPTDANAQHWVHITAPFNAGVALQLTGGNILIQETGTSNWHELIPDNLGNYDTGTFGNESAFPPTMNYDPTFFASGVLPDDRVIVEGGEYDNGDKDYTNKGAIFDPQTHMWTEVKAPTGWSQIADAPSAVVNFGGTWKYMLADFNGTDFATLDPSTLMWTVDPGDGKFDINEEEGWTLLPGGDVLTVDAYFNKNNERTGTKSEIYNPSKDIWTIAGSTVVQLWDSDNGCGPAANDSNEVGPAVLRPDGTVFATGANTCPGKAGHTAIYNVKTKKWTKGPHFPNHDDMADAPAAVLPNGNVLVATNPGWGNSPITFYEFNGTKFLTTTPQPPGLTGNTENDRMLVLPNGHIMLTDTGTPDIWFYFPKGTYKSAWQPKITALETTVPGCITEGDTYTVKGTQFNGLTQGAYYGDDAQSATNYPLVRITNNATKHVTFQRTHDFSTMAVATGKQIVSTQFDVSTKADTGASTMVVIANGIPSPGKTIDVENPCL